MRKNIKRAIVLSVIIFFLFAFFVSCASNEAVVDRGGRAQQQSLVVDLTVECHTGNKDACERLEREKKKLMEMLLK